MGECVAGHTHARGGHGPKVGPRVGENQSEDGSTYGNMLGKLLKHTQAWKGAQLGCRAVVGGKG